MTRVSAMLQRRCACGGTPGPDGECAECKAKRLQRSAAGVGPSVAPPIVHDVLRSPGRPLEPSVRGQMEARFAHDFSRVRVHADARAAESARAVNAQAYTVGSNVVFGEGRYAPMSSDGGRLLSHELTHVVQQGAVGAPAGPLPIERADSTAEQAAQRGEAPQRGGSQPAVQREPTFADTTCDHVKSNIERAWPTAKSWVSHARRELSNPKAVAGELGTHFKLDPNDSAQAGDLSYVQNVFRLMEEIFDRQVPHVCTPPNVGEKCHLADGREYGAFVTDGVFQITFCTEAADVGRLRGQGLIETLVHEVSHLADPPNTDWAYRHSPGHTTYARMTRAQAIQNGDSYSEFARDLYLGGAPPDWPLFFSLGTGAFLSEHRPRWAITVGESYRSRSGLEVFDLVGGVHGFFTISGGDDPDFSKQGPVIGGIADFGVISRSPQTKLFVDTRLGAWVAADPRASGVSTGVSARALIGWASGGWRAGADMRLLYDALNGNNAMIIGVELGYNP